VPVLIPKKTDSDETAMNLTGRQRDAAVEDAFCELRPNGVLGSSLSSGAARKRQRIRREGSEDGI
jgi:hypothetical protein